MIDMKKLVSVRNRNNGGTTYVLSDMHITRRFGAGETKEIPFDELRALSYAPGGEYMLENCLVVEDDEALRALNMKVEPEYFYNEENIKEMLLTKTYDEFADFLDFAPEGAIELAKEIAVKEMIPDSKKREMLEQKTGFSVDNAIKINKIMDTPAASSTPEQKTRRVATTETAATTTTARRAATPQIVIKDKNTK